MSELYDRIEELCRSRKVNITEMCKASGASRGSLTDLKMGRTKKLSTDSLSKIAEYFGISTDELLGRDVDGIEAELVEYLEMLRSRPECRMLMSTMKHATREEVEANVRVIEALRGINRDEKTH